MARAAATLLCGGLIAASGIQVDFEHGAEGGKQAGLLDALHSASGVAAATVAANWVRTQLPLRQPQTPQHAIELNRKHMVTPQQNLLQHGRARVSADAFRGFSAAERAREGSQQKAKWTAQGAARKAGRALFNQFAQQQGVANASDMKEVNSANLLREVMRMQGKEEIHETGKQASQQASQVSHRKAHTRHGVKKVHVNFMRHNYMCPLNHNYRAWLSKHAEKLTSLETDAKENGLDKDVLFLGNSFTQELADSLLLAMKDDIVKMEVLMEPSGTMQTIPNSMMCDGKVHHGKYCSASVARYTLKGGGHVYIASDHPITYDGMPGMKAIMNLLEVNLAKLDAVVLGFWNSLSNVRTRGWETRPVALTTTGHGPVYKYAGQWAPWTPEQVAKGLENFGFKGKLFLGGANFQVARQRAVRLQGSYPFKVTPLQAYNDESKVEELVSCAAGKGDEACTPSAGSFQCVPGPTSLAAHELYNHLVGSHL